MISFYKVEWASSTCSFCKQNHFHLIFAKLFYFLVSSIFNVTLYLKWLSFSMKRKSIFLENSKVDFHFSKHFLCNRILFLLKILKCFHAFKIKPAVWRSQCWPFLLHQWIISHHETRVNINQKRFRHNGKVFFHFIATKRRKLKTEEEWKLVIRLFYSSDSTYRITGIEIP